ncbi:hypothetical protein Tco_0970110 [Tanacetum coccineum]
MMLALERREVLVKRCWMFLLRIGLHVPCDPDLSLSSIQTLTNGNPASLQCFFHAHFFYRSGSSYNNGIMGHHGMYFEIYSALQETRRFLEQVFRKLLWTQSVGDVVPLSFRDLRVVPTILYAFDVQPVTLGNRTSVQITVRKSPLRLPAPAIWHRVPSERGSNFCVSNCY